MRLSCNKKAIAFSKLIEIILIVVGAAAILLVIPSFMDKAEASTAETVCRASLMAREKTTVDLIVKDVQLTPLLCKTIDKEIPKKKNAKKEEVMKEFAESMARCWWQFGNGLIDDVFKEGDPTTNNCFICYDIKTKKTSEFKEKIDGKEFLEYLVKTPYKIEIEGDKCKNFGGACSLSKEICNSKNSGEGVNRWESDENNLVCKQKYNEEKNKKPVCCYSDYSCLNNGGECSTNLAKTGFVEYNKWECPPNEKCYIKDKNYVTYARYIQSYDGYGNIIITTPIEPEKAYAVSFGSPTTTSCDFCIAWGIGTGVGFAILTVATVGSGGVALPLLIGAAAGLGEYFGAREYYNIFNRNINTIYLTTLDEALAESRCNLVDSKGDTIWSQGGGSGGAGAGGPI